MITYILKDMKLILRNRSELLLLFAMPLILIAILGFALRGMLTGGGEGLSMDVALLDHDDPDAGEEALFTGFRESGMPEDMADEIQAGITGVSPAFLLNNLFDSDELDGMITIHEPPSRDAALMGLEDGTYNAVLEIPESFTYDSLNRMLTGEGEGGQLHLTVQDEQSIYGRVMHDILRRFTDSFNLETAIARETGAAPDEAPTEAGQVESITAYEPINSQQFYTAGMAVMFVLFTAASIAAFANVERKSNVLDRILLSGTHAISYLSGKWLSAMLIAFLQLIVLFVMAALMFQAFPQSSVSFWGGIALISLLTAMNVGALAALLTAISIRQKSDAAATVFSGGVVAIMAFAGGSFFPAQALPGIVTTLGDMTPNGRAMSLYLRWIQGFELQELLPSIYVLLLIAAVLTTAALVLYPKDREVKG
ncbi:ABC transporter permease [Salisediminibacterium selenitireducens]|uniref:ABC-2 type transporter n=1 Tax=Bacillus selenitireducens (strain ATCC 700615 / DSM 15326 / MLS10) TaxID=439292 RepID=D6XWI7_BACIE|nr:ABC transporter permease [Salisediminibacterium selenitireducens]ADH97829.1 ABC-2 type transporter [[Bacillus] selenitireducens MLS10]